MVFVFPRVFAESSRQLRLKILVFAVATFLHNFAVIV